MPSAEYLARVERVARKLCIEAGCLDPNQRTVDLSRGRCLRGDVWVLDDNFIQPAWQAFREDAEAALRVTADD